MDKCKHAAQAGEYMITRPMMRALARFEVALLEITFPLAQNKLLYGVYDDAIAVYRYYVEASLEGEPPVYEELYDIRNDPGELQNQIDDPSHAATLQRLKAAWKQKLTGSRDRRPEGAPLHRRQRRRLSIQMRIK